ncbi:hypothetical protein JXJ21_06375 [candidate division KSB1 bacterium]|nr:hypothetical protein [candidate division KSB1 bacterium]
MNSFLIRAEDKNQWETRTPITPTDLKEILAETNATAYIQHSDKRRFSLDQFIEAGATAVGIEHPAKVIFGIKEIPVEKIESNKVYVYFSHTVKGQSVNMPALKKIVDSGSTLIDYEKITDENGRRLIYFGRYAGDAGAVDILWLLGEYWENQGILNPFTAIKQAMHYDSVKCAQEKLDEVGRRIKTEGLPQQISPLVIGIMGYGNVSGGAQAIFDCLPVERIAPEALASRVSNGELDNRCIYLSIFKEHHLVERADDAAFNLQEYYNNPGKYVSRFSAYLPYLNIIVNALYWDKRYPKFVTWDLLKTLFTQNPDHRLYGIADITCDVNGAIECNVKVTDSGSPAYLCNPIDRTITNGHRGKGIVILAVDNLPCEFSYDASVFFSNQFKRFAPNILSSNFSEPLKLSGLVPDIQKAVIVYNGQLTENYTYLNQYL